MHPLGQTLIITSGLGWAQQWEGPVEEIRPGDIVWFPPGVKHWHGATPTTAMTHIANSGIAERQDCRLAGEGQRRAISGRLKGMVTADCWCRHKKPRQSGASILSLGSDFSSVLLLHQLVLVA
jgi:hypothetical protein